MRIANAPCSWGVLEFEGMVGQGAGWETVLDEIAATGYAATELGDLGFMPTDPAQLSNELAQRNLAMLGAYVPVRLRDQTAHQPGIEQALTVARLLAAVATADSKPGPFLVLADDCGTDPVRTVHAGRATPEMGLPAADFATFAAGVEAVARAVRDETGLPLVFHPHSAGFVETPAEIRRLAAATDPDLVGFVFDTGHFLFGAGPAGADHLAMLDDLGPRVRHVHFKDLEPEVAARSRAEQWPYFKSLEQGVFCELGQGAVDFPAVADSLRTNGYDGWIVVEQDVLPGMGAPRESAQRNRDYLRSIGH
jgi:inosose dehydratase